MRRRQFIAGLGATAWPLAARAQRAAMPVIGYLGAGSAYGWRHGVAAFHQGLKEAGFVGGQNVEVEYRWAEDRYERLPALADELVHRQVTVIFAGQSTPAALAARAATNTIPIVFTVGVDPVRFGLVASFDHPGGNATGVNFLTSELVGKQFEIIRELVPNSSAIGLLINPDNPFAEATTRDAQEAARVSGRKIVVVGANSEPGLDAAFDTLVQRRAAAVQVPGDGFYYTRRDRLVALALRHALPAIYAQREFVDDGGLMNYGANIQAANRIAGVYVGRILRGEQPGDLPVQQSTRIELIVNMKAAKTLGIDVPTSILLRADEVIE